MSFHADSMPNLISSKTIKNMDKVFQTGGDINSKHASWNSNFSDFYVNYIQPNFFSRTQARRPKTRQKISSGSSHFLGQSPLS